MCPSDRWPCVVCPVWALVTVITQQQVHHHHQSLSPLDGSTGGWTYSVTTAPSVCARHIKHAFIPPLLSVSSGYIEGYLWTVTWLDGRIWTEINVLTSNLIWLGGRIWIETLYRPEILLYVRHEVSGKLCSKPLPNSPLSRKCILFEKIALKIYRNCKKKLTAEKYMDDPGPGYYIINKDIHI